MMLMLIKLRVQRLGGVLNMSQCNRDLRKVRYCRLPMLVMFILSGQICPRVRCNVVSMAIVPHDQGESGKSVCIAMRFTLRNGGSGGTGRLRCRYVVARAIAMLVDIVKEGVVKLFSGSIIVQNSGQR